jgi:hypothetical protein
MEAAPGERFVGTERRHTSFCNLAAIGQPNVTTVESCASAAHAELRGFAFEVLEVDEDAGGEDERAFVEVQLGRFERDAEAVGVGEGFL